jgi:protein-S-isoprenylcysteine O-methyltransferase Ste14
MRIIGTFDSWIIEAPYGFGLLCQVWFVLTRPCPQSSDLSVVSVVVTALSVLFPYSYELAPSGTPPDEAVVLLIGGASSLLYLWSALTLGRSFAILPAVSGLISKGPYRYMRHPIYASYLLFDFLLLTSTDTWFLMAVWGVELMLFCWRAILEETLFERECNGYVLYRESVRSRFIPSFKKLKSQA